MQFFHEYISFIQAEKEGNDEFDDVDDQQIDPKMWEGDDDESEKEDDEEQK